MSEPDKERHDHGKVAKVKVLWEGLVVDSLLTLWARFPHHSVLSAPATPIFGSLGIFHLFYRRSVSLFPPGFTPVSLESLP